MVVVPKKGGSIRICVDLKPLNKSVLREVHPLPRVDEILAQLSGAKIFRCEFRILADPFVPDLKTPDHLHNSCREVLLQQAAFRHLQRAGTIPKAHEFDSGGAGGHSMPN